MKYTHGVDLRTVGARYEVRRAGMRLGVIGLLLTVAVAIVRRMPINRVAAFCVMR